MVVHVEELGDAGVDAVQDRLLVGLHAVQTVLGHEHWKRNQKSRLMAAVSDLSCLPRKFPCSSEDFFLFPPRFS